MRRKAKLIITSAVVAALTVAGLSVAAGGSGGDGGPDSRTAGPTRHAQPAGRLHGERPKVKRDSPLPP